MAEPTPQEILMLALINRARLDPAGEAARDNIDLNEGLAAGTISTASKQPLAFSAALYASADAHSQEMINRDYFAHVDPTTGSTPQTRGNAAGYSGGVGENIAWSGSTGPIDATQMIFSQEAALFVDSGTDGRGHRTNLLSASYQQVGVGQVLGLFTTGGNTYNSSMITQDFGVPSASGQFLTGIAYNDTDANAFYSVGEGRAAVTVATSSGSTTTGTAGAYSSAIGAGSQTVTFSGGGLAGAVTVTLSVTSGQNTLLDLVGASTVETSASLTAVAGVTKIIGLGNLGLTLNGSSSDDYFVSSLGNDFINGGAGTDSVQFVGARSAYVITDMGNGTLTVVGASGSDTLTGIEDLVFSDQTVLVGSGTPTAAKTKSDFTSDGTSDILLQNGGTVVDWIMQGGTYQSGNVLTTGAIGYKVVGTGDFNADGTSDVVLQNGGNVVDWIMKNGTYQSGNMITSDATGFNVVGTGDFNGDGTSDILLQNGGTVVAWLMQNGVYQSGNLITTGATGYKVVGTGDFNGDGTSDVLLQKGGIVVDWVMKNGVYQSGNVITTGATGFNVVGTGDYSGDGTADVLLQNGGTVVDWIMKNGTYQSGNVITTGATGYAGSPG